MERKKASDFHPEVMKLFQGYVHGSVSRRQFLDGASKFAVGGFTAAAMFEALKPNFAWANQVPKDDARIRTETVSYTSSQGSGKISGYLVKPAKGAAKLPAIVVIHENRGLNPYIEDVARRLGVLGYLAFAPDSLSPFGGYPGDEDKAREMFAKQDRAKMIEDLLNAVPYVKARNDTTGKIGAVGFCFGGGVVNQMAVRFPDLAASAPYYGAQPKPDDVAKIKAPIMAHYASEDPGINKGIPAFDEALKANKVRHELHTYPNTQHGFHNDTTPRYDEAAAKLSWQRTVDFFNKNVKAT
ncbi:MAG TPA: dienelactone hydrolase family protein [Burkholderiales bacterium]|nr:dienelactone hydrolase family protein [Burkholderiales bacterium]